ncbi:hypothetical protein C1645_709568 [Glomus cerebriforme]|uniref:Uncharacterized protein n=1 Tax=Glomus cerebriforme TaxID=658196 RepID=A0A397THK7_9GLOM|nr:hypothetical protein C1645_709568 [Glomus cerebriforme]
MFRKPPSNIKSYSPLRSSDRRRFKEEILKKFPLLESSLKNLIETTDTTNSKLESPSNIIVPENTQLAKFTSNLGIHGVIYTTKEKQPIWFKKDKDKNEILVPSVYILWKFPDMLPKIPTFDIVISKLTGGANLMIPGIAFPPGGLPEVNEDELVSIVVRGSDIPVAVGTMNISTKLLHPGSTRKGVAVNIIHIFGDCLWSMGDQSNPPGFADAVTSQDEASGSKDADIFEEMDEDIEVESLKNEFDSKLTISEVDKLLEDSFYQALLEKLTPTAPLPMPTSQFYSAYILPCRPVGTENEVDIKKSSYKKVTKFLNAMEKKGIIKIKGSREDSILTHVDWKHDSLNSFRPHKTIKKATASTATDEGHPSIQIKKVFKPKGAAIDLFRAQGQNVETNTVYEAEEIKSIVLDYLKSHNLSDKQDPKFIIPDEQIREVLINKSGGRVPDKWVRNDLVKEITSKMEDYHYVILPNHDPELRKGLPKSIQIVESTRTGNKIVTNIRGLENYGINPNDLIEPLQRLCASSVSVNPTPQSSPKKPLMEVMVQGPQIKLIKKYLIDTKGFPEKYIETVKKKGKK